MEATKKKPTAKPKTSGTLKKPGQDQMNTLPSLVPKESAVKPKWTVSKPEEPVAKQFRSVQFKRNQRKPKRNQKSWLSRQNCLPPIQRRPHQQWVSLTTLQPQQVNLVPWVSQSCLVLQLGPEVEEKKTEDNPPQLSFKLPKQSDVPNNQKQWQDVDLPVDILLLTAEVCEFLSCLCYLDEPFKCYRKETGFVYFGSIGSGDQEKLKVALMTCSKSPGGSLTATDNAVKVLRPKAVFSVGVCSSLKPEKVKLGDVVTASKLTTLSYNTPVSRDTGNLFRDAGSGWKPPLRNPGEREVIVHRDGVILSEQLAATCKWKYEDIIQQYPEAIAMESEGEGLYAAAHDNKVEWMIVKGVASYGDQTRSSSSNWSSFASTMAASVVASILKNPGVFQEWPHYNKGDNRETSKLTETRERKENEDEVIFLASFHSPEVVFEQLSVIYKIPRLLARSFTAIVPYFPTGTMEREEIEGRVATAKTLAMLLSTIPLTARGPSQIMVFDIHALQERFYFTDNVIPRLETAIPLLLREIAMLSQKNTVSIAFPDEGAFKRFHTMFNSFPTITCTKIRDGDKRIVKVKDGDPSGHHAIIVDDLVMTGGTLVQCAKALLSAGAVKISAYVTHAVFPKESWKLFTDCEVAFDKFYITDSLPHASDIAQHPPFKILSLCDSISEALLGFDLLQS